MAAVGLTVLATQSTSAPHAALVTAFMTNWSGRTVKDLVDATSRAMPKDKPGSLGPRAYVDVIAYILQANKFPGGTVELDRDPERLDQIFIERSRK